MWNQQWREAAWARLKNEPWDLLIIGGGITGAGILRRASQLGLRAALVEQKDFAWGTSSRSSKLIHGGLRYLRDANFGLMHESVVEREWLLREAPGLVEPLGFLIAYYEGDKPAWRMNQAALLLQDLFTGEQRFSSYDRTEFQMLMPLVRRKGLKGGFRFLEGQVDDARLVIRLLRESAAGGALPLNYARVAQLTEIEGRITGARIEDQIASRSANVQAKVIINATGVWVDELRGQIAQAAMMRPLRGSHLVLPHVRLPLYQAVTFLHPQDRRHIFAYPWEGTTLVGTTDLDHASSLSLEPRITAEEVEYLMSALAHYFPTTPLNQADIISTYAGVRPVAAYGTDVNPSRAPRDHVIQEEKGLVTVTGGKLSTFRVVAEQVVDHIKPQFSGLARHSKSTPYLSIPNFNKEESEVCPTSLSSSIKRRLYGRYGAEARTLIESASPEELQPIPGSMTLWAEVRWAARAEGVIHLDDLLLRRLRLGNTVPNGAIHLMPALKAICQQELGWNNERWQQEETRYHQLYEAAYTLPPPRLSDNQPGSATY